MSAPIRRRTTALLAGGLVAAGLAGCANHSVGSSGDQGFVAGTGDIQVVKAADRAPVGDVAGPTLSGKHASLKALRGSVVVVNIWGSWCGPCRKEAPALADAARQLAPRGVRFLGIDSRNPEKAAPQAFESRYKVPYPSIYDPGGRTLLGFHGQVGPNAIPSTVVIDRRGRIAAAVNGPVTRATLVDIVGDVTGKGST